MRRQPRSLDCDQRLRRFQLLRLLQCFLGHFVSPSFDLPYWASAQVYAKQSPNSSVASRPCNLFKLRYFVSQSIRRQKVTHPCRVELIIIMLRISTRSAEDCISFARVSLRRPFPFGKREPGDCLKNTRNKKRGCSLRGCSPLPDPKILYLS